MRSARQGHGQQVNEQYDWDGYKCCKGNKTGWCAVRVMGGEREGTGHSFLYVKEGIAE